MIIDFAWGAWAVIAIRLTVPLLMFRFPLWGGVAAIMADTVDVSLARVLGNAELSNYILLDKILDAYSLFIMFLVTLRWERPVWITALMLLIVRVIGVILIAPSPGTSHGLLLFFPAVLDLFYLFCAARVRYFPSFVLSGKRLAVVLGVLLVLKLGQEAIQHNAFVQSWPLLRTYYLLPFGIVQ